MKRRRVEVLIDELLLHGFEHRDRHAIGDAIEREITRLMASPHQLSLRSSPRMDAGSFHAGKDAKPQAVGTETARAVVRGLRK